MFDVVMNSTAILSFCFPAMPWLFGALWRRRGIWWSAAGCVVILLVLFPPLFWTACVAANCGQGAIAIFVLGPIWFASGLVTMASAAIADFIFTRRATKPKPKREPIAD